MAATWRTVGDEARRIRVRLGAGVDEVAAAAGMEPATVAAFQDGRAVVDAADIDRIGRVLGTSGRRLLRPAQPSVAVAADGAMLAVHDGPEGTGLPTDAERDLAEVVEAIGDMTGVLARRQDVGTASPSARAIA